MEALYSKSHSKNLLAKRILRICVPHRRPNLNTSKISPNKPPCPEHHIPPPSTRARTRSHRKAGIAFARARRAQQTPHTSWLLLPDSKQGASSLTTHSRALVDSACACAGVRSIGDEDDDEGEGVAGSYMLPSSIPSGATDCLRSATRSVPSAVSGDYTETTECVRDEPGEAAGGVYALRGGSDVSLQICERAELRCDDGTESLCAPGAESLVGQRSFVVLRGGYWGFLERFVCEL